MLWTTGVPGVEMCARHEIASNTSSCDLRISSWSDAMITLPDWTPTFVRPLLKQLDLNPACKGQRRIAFERLVNDKRMHAVYDQFSRRDRKSDTFLYPAKKRAHKQTFEQAQLAALRQVLQVTISAAGDRVSVSKLEQLDDARERWGELASQLRALARDLDLAIDLGQLGLDDRKSRRQAERDIIGLIHVANWLDCQTLTLRPPEDPLIVRRNRGDPVVRGVQILVSRTFKEQFGVRLDGTAATLASVALGAKASARVSRSALTAKKPEKKRTAR
jgi:hypothetical protein